MGVLETTLSALIVAAVSGLAFAAYKHPGAYNRYYWFLMALSVAVFIAIMTYGLGYEIASTTSRRFVSPDKSTEFEAAISRYALSFVWVLLGSIACSLYLTFLSVLPHILRSEK